MAITWVKLEANFGRRRRRVTGLIALGPTLSSLTAACPAVKPDGELPRYE